MDKNNSHNIRPSNTITGNENNTQSKNLIRTVSVNQSYASTTKHSKKKHVSWAIDNLFNNSINEGKAHLSSLSGATINRLDHFITPMLE